MNELIDDYYHYESGDKKENQSKREIKIKEELSPKEMEIKL